MGKQIISSDSIQVKETLGEGEFGVVQQGTWTTENGEKVCLKFFITFSYNKLPIPIFFVNEKPVTAHQWIISFLQMDVFTC